MTKEEAKDLIVTHISDIQGCKTTELAVWLASEIEKQFDGLQLLEELISEKRIVEIEYTLPNMGYRVKTFLLPGNTEVTVRGK